MYANHNIRLILIASALVSVLLVAPVLAEDPATYDPRFGVVATDSSGWDGPVKPMQGPQFFEPLATAWWYNYSPRIESYEVPGLMLSWPGSRVSSVHGWSLVDSSSWRFTPFAMSCVCKRSALGQDEPPPLPSSFNYPGDTAQLKRRSVS